MRMYIYQRINDLVFDADQQPKVRLAGNDHSFALLCKESTDLSWTSSDIFDCNTI